MDDGLYRGLAEECATFVSAVRELFYSDDDVQGSTSRRPSKTGIDGSTNYLSALLTSRSAASSSA
jgi:hypothetical protein